MLIRKLSLILLSSVLYLVAATCQNAEEPSNADPGKESAHVVLSKVDFKKRLAEADNYVLVDVRTPEEYRAGHIKGAINIDFLNPPVFEKQFSKLDTAQTLMIYCRSGSRSRNSAEKLQAMGFKKIYDLEGGYLNWQKEE